MLHIEEKIPKVMADTNENQIELHELTVHAMWDLDVRIMMQQVLLHAQGHQRIVAITHKGNEHLFNETLSQIINSMGSYFPPAHGLRPLSPNTLV